MSLDEMSEALDLLENQLRTAKLPSSIVRETMGLVSRLVGESITARNAAAFWRDQLARLHARTYTAGRN